MKFELNDQTLSVTAESVAEVMEVFKHYKLADTPEGIQALADALKVGTYIHLQPSKKREWHELDVYHDRALEPYRKLLKQLTGYDDSLPNMDLTALYPHRLNYTIVVNSIEIVDGMLHAEVFIQAGEWNGEAAEVRAQKNADDYIQEYVGKRKHEREFIPNSSGSYNPNPNYLKHHRAEPGLGAPWLWKAIFSWWRENHASTEQRSILDAVDALRKGYKLEPDYDIRHGGGEQASLIGFSLYALDPAGTCNYDGKGKMASVYSWDEFKAAGAVEVSR